MRLSPVVAAAVALALCVSAGAIAGTRKKDRSAATAPTVDGDGISLADSIGCRMSARVDGGGNLNSGTLIPMYKDTSGGAISDWQESASSLWCTIAPMADGGLRSAFPCPDMEPLARYGLISVKGYAVKGLDGGTGAALLSDAGTGTQPVLRVECWGPAIP